MGKWEKFLQYSQGPFRKILLWRWEVFAMPGNSPSGQELAQEQWSAGCFNSVKQLLTQCSQLSGIPFLPAQRQHSPCHGAGWASHTSLTLPGSLEHCSFRSFSWFLSKKSVHNLKSWITLSRQEGRSGYLGLKLLSWCTVGCRWKFIQWEHPHPQSSQRGWIRES